MPTQSRGHGTRSVHGRMSLNMRSCVLAVLTMSVAVACCLALTVPPIVYRIDFDPAKDVTLLDEDKDKRQGLFINVRFTITQIAQTADDVFKDYKILIKEDGHVVKQVEVPQPVLSDDLSVVLALDVSGSMREFGKLRQAKQAAAVFFDKLPGKTECGLILFDDKIKTAVPVTPDRGLLRQHVQASEPGGGTAYLDATRAAIQMLRGATTKGKAVVVMTDGVDLNSRAALDEVIEEARQANVRVYTVGIGEPGRQEPVTTVLALDKSGSMLAPADNSDKVRKIDALREAAARFVNSIGPTARSTILEFSDTVTSPAPFTHDKRTLRATIEGLEAGGETAVLDATYAAIATLEAEGAPGKRAVVALTDGIDNSSRRRVEEVIARAQQAKTRWNPKGIPLYMLGFGRAVEGELGVKVMSHMAQATGGEYFHAKNRDALVQIFEKLSIQIHDDGIDEVTLQQLAQKTGGQYYAAKNIKELDLILTRVTQSIPPKHYEITFPSLRQVRDGRARHVTLELIRRGQVVQRQEGAEQVRGLVVPELNPVVYLGLLGVIGVLIALPALLRKAARPSTPM
jgi:Mg-chelatase subunit ChlD